MSAPGHPASGGELAIAGGGPRLRLAGRAGDRACVLDADRQSLRWDVDVG